MPSANEGSITVVWTFVIIVYLAIGVIAMLWIRRDNEFRQAQTAEIFMYASIVAWPILAPLWTAFRPPEQLEDLAAKKTYQDFKNFMRSRKPKDSDLLASLEKTRPDAPYEIGTDGPEFRDLHLEELIDTRQYQEALRTANDMLRFAREQQEHSRVEAYQRYIKDIKEKRRIDLG